MFRRAMWLPHVGNYAPVVEHSARPIVPCSFSVYFIGAANSGESLCYAGAPWLQEAPAPLAACFPPRSIAAAASAANMPPACLLYAPAPVVEPGGSPNRP